jgi:hypothetical protein
MWCIRLRIHRSQGLAGLKLYTLRTVATTAPHHNRCALKGAPWHLSGWSSASATTRRLCRDVCTPSADPLAALQRMVPSVLMLSLRWSHGEMVVRHAASTATGNMHGSTGAKTRENIMHAGSLPAPPASCACPPTLSAAKMSWLIGSSTSLALRMMVHVDRGQIHATSWNVDLDHL